MVFRLLEKMSVSFVILTRHIHKVKNWLLSC